MEYIAELRRAVKDGMFPLGTVGYLDVYRESDEHIAFAEPVASFVTLEPEIPVISVGEHNLAVTYSPRFSPRLPYRRYRGVPLISSPSCPACRGIRIHIGNTVRDTRGCVLIGTDLCQDGLLNSRQAYISFMKFASHINKFVVYEPY